LAIVELAAGLPNDRRQGEVASATLDLNSISVTEADEYSVLLCPWGPVPVDDLGLVYGRGVTVQEALADALERLKADLEARRR
jgi:hypothetical protein